MKTGKGKVFVLIGMIALLVVTGALNIYLNQSAQDTQANATLASSDFFVTYRADRTETRNQELLNLDAIISGGVSGEDAIAQAEIDKRAITVAMEMELKLEGLIKAAGFEDAVIINSEENLSVILRAPQELTSEQVTTVLKIVTDETGKKASNIRIIPVE